MRMLRTNFFTSRLSSLTLALILTSSSSSWADTPLRPNQIQKTIIDHSIALTFTPRGQSYFGTHLEDVLAENGFVFNEGQIDNWKYQAGQPIQLENLPVSFGDTKTTMGNLIQIIQQTLPSLTLHDPQPTVNVDNIQYMAQFSHFGLRLDSKATIALGHSDSVIIDLELEIPNLSVSASSIIANDPENPSIAYTDKAHPKMQNWGMDNFSAALSPGVDAKTGKAVNLRFKVPLEVSIDSNIGISVKALNVSTNLPQVAADWGFSHPLVYPSFDIESGGQVISHISFQALEDKIDESKKELAQSLTAYLQKYLSENGPAMINKALVENHFTSIVEDVNEMSPVSAPANTNPPNLIYGLLPERLSLSPQGLLSFQSNSYAEDPTANESAPLSSPVASMNTPDLGSADPSTYDIAISANQNFVNRLMQLSYNRGYYKNMAFGGSNITLTEAPYFSLDSNLPGKNYARLHLAISTVYSASGFFGKIGSALMLSNPLKMNFDMILRYKVDPAKGELTLIIDHFDTNSIKLDESSVTSMLFWGTVMDRCKSTLADYNKGYAAKETPLTTPFNVPQLFMGVPLKLKDVQSDSWGFFDIFLEYGN